jgi:AcrR family transcriptional regulator
MARPRTVSDEDVLAGAVQVVTRLGPYRATLADVGAEIGLSPAALVKRFGSKRGLLLAIARHGARALPERIASAAHAQTPVDALIDVLSGIAGAIQTQEEFANHLAFLLLDLSDPEFQQITRRYAIAIESAVDGVLQAGQTAGELAAGDLRALPGAVHAVYNGALITWGMSGEGSPADHVRSRLQQLIRPYRAAIRA